MKQPTELDVLNAMSLAGRMTAESKDKIISALVSALERIEALAAREQSEGRSFAPHIRTAASAALKLAEGK